MELQQFYTQISRYAIDAILLLVALRMVTKRSKKHSIKNTIKKYKALLKLGLFLYLIVFFMIPVVIGSFSQRAKYFPQYLEAQKLRGYYRCIAFFPGATYS